MMLSPRSCRREIVLGNDCRMLGKRASICQECGIRLEGFNDLKEGDVLEVYRIEEIGRKFDE